MLIIGCDYHPGFQQIAFVDKETGECGERRLSHREEAEQFYRALLGQKVRVGMEASGHARWFERLLNELQFELWIGDAAEIRSKRVRKQKTDRQDAQLLLRLLIEDRFSANLGTGRRESRSATTAVASASLGADADSSDESVARGSTQRRPAAQESLMASGGSAGAGVDRTGSLGEPPAAGPARLTRSTDAENPATDGRLGRRSGKTSCDAAFGDASRSRTPDGVGLRVGNRNAGAFSLWQTDRQLRRTGSDGRVQRRSPSTGTHQQTGQRVAALSAGGSGAGHGAQSTRVAQ